MIVHDISVTAIHDYDNAILVEVDFDPKMQIHSEVVDTTKAMYKCKLTKSRYKPINTDFSLSVFKHYRT